MSPEKSLALNRTEGEALASRIAFSRAEVAEMLGICQRQVKNLEDEGLLPATRFMNRRPRYLRADVEKLLEYGLGRAKLIAADKQALRVAQATERAAEAAN